MNNTMKLVIAAVVSVAIAAGSYFAMQNSKDYIDGNIINFDISTNQHKGMIAIPWLTNGFSANLLYRSLFQPDHTLLNISPDLASYEMKEDGLTYVITLSDNNFWSDGEPITMQDVMWSIETVQKLARPHYFYVPTFSNIDTMEAEGNVLTIKLKEKSTLFIRVLAQLVILPHHALAGYSIEELPAAEDFWAKPITSGMYKYNTTVEDTYISFVRNEHYTKKKPKIDEVRMILNPDLVKSDYYFSNSNIAEILNFRAMRGFNEFPIDMSFFRYWVFNIEGIDGNKNPAMSDIRVRQAICMAIDREKALRDIYLSMGRITDGRGLTDVEDPLAYNPEKAKQLLLESGYDLNRPLRITHYHRDSATLEFLRIAQRQLEEVGFKVKVEVIQHPNYILVERPYDVLLKGFGAFQPTEWYEEYHSTYNLNALHGGKGELDELLAQARGEYDPLKYDILLSELARRELELLYKYPLLTLSQAFYVNTDRIAVPANFTPGNIFYLYDMKFEEWSVKKQ